MRKRAKPETHERDLAIKRAWLALKREKVPVDERVRILKEGYPYLSERSILDIGRTRFEEIDRKRTLEYRGFKPEFEEDK